MASIILGQIGEKVGNAALGSVGATIGHTLGSYIGKQIDNSSYKSDAKIQGRKLYDLNIQTSTYGKMIPIIYGNFKIAGNIIWGRPIEEKIIEEEASSAKNSTQINRFYNYRVTLAIAICEGEVDSLIRVWADTKQLDLSKQEYYRFYNGSEDQMPDPLIESYMGTEETPAYRGLCYIVIADFPIGDYGNRIPNFTFEIRRRAPLINDQPEAEEMIKSMVLIPGSGEFVYDTIIQTKINGIEVEGKFLQQGYTQQINKHTAYNYANSIVALNQLQETCKNLEWVAPVVTWFANSVNLHEASIFPAVEYKDGTKTTPDEWSVAGYDRKNAYLISWDFENKPNYGGSVNDLSVIRFLDELKSRKLKIMFYPMFFIDMPGKPWRGRLTGKAEDVEFFFNHPAGYNRFILHYAKLIKGKIDAFIIGSELVNITKIKDKNNEFVAVKELIKLAADVRKILGPNVKISYAADWSEYHHTEGGWYHLDELWASENIDFIGIDAYFPLTMNNQGRFDIREIKEGWHKGEGYDFYYDDERNKKALLKEYAWKNINWWWENYHINPDGKTTNWIPKSKKIWFTEYGYPSIDAAPNQPNVFYDPDSIEGNIPLGSKGKIDFLIQRQSIQATEEVWLNSEIVEQKFVWTWDMRPYPAWPDLKSVWNDYKLWSKGHWVSGKLGMPTLSSVVADLCIKADMKNFEVLELNEIIEGYAITYQQTARQAIEALSAAYLFESAAYADKIKFFHKKNNISKIINREDIISENQSPSFSSCIIEEMELPMRIEVGFINKFFNYEEGYQFAQKYVTNSQKIINISFPLVLNDMTAKNIAEIKLHDYWLERKCFDFTIPYKFLNLEIGDLIRLVDKTEYTVRIIKLDIIEERKLKVKAVVENIHNYDFKSDIEIYYNNHNINFETSINTIFHILDIPKLPWEYEDELRVLIAACGDSKNWKGASVFASDNQGNKFKRLVNIEYPSVIGATCQKLDSAPVNIMDNTNSIEVILIDGILESVTNDQLLEGNNLAIIGEEIIQFKNAKLIEPNKYLISGFIRGLYGTENLIDSHLVGDRFIILDKTLTKLKMSKHDLYKESIVKAVTYNERIDNVQGFNFNFSGNSLAPLAPSNFNVYLKEDNICMDWETSYKGALYEINFIEENNVIYTATTNQDNYTLELELIKNKITKYPCNLNIKISKVSDLVGKGHSSSANITIYADL
ncbi:MAG: glycoside hydrolase TIM-barrel-like domain-containing protein [Alphaproteobacteria bacterium]